MAALGGDSRRAGAKEVRQAFEVLLVKQHEPCFFVARTFCPNSAASVASRSPIAARRALAQARACAGAGEIEMIALEHARLFGGKPEPVLPGLERVDALEQRLVQISFVAMAGEDGGDFALDRLQFIIGRGASEIEEDAADAIEAAAAALERLDRIGEGGRRRVCGDRIDFAPRDFQRSVESGPEMAGLDTVERRRLERPRPGFEKGILIEVGIRHKAIMLL